MAPLTNPSFRSINPLKPAPRVVFGVLLVSLIHLRQLEAAKKLCERRYWSDEDEKLAVERVRELTEEERLHRVRVYDSGDVL
jgi:hypothetical protein